MELLKQKIREDGKVIGDRILKVDNFLNHQIDIRLFNEIGKEFKKRFQGVEIDKIITIESSGIGVAAVTSQYFGFVPVVFAKKSESLIMDDNVYLSKVHSFTKDKDYIIRISKDYIKKGEKVLIIDDFLANGCAALGLLDILTEAGAEVIGVGIVIEKGFQNGRKELEKRGVRIESLVIIDEMKNNKVYFK